LDENLKPADHNVSRHIDEVPPSTSQAITRATGLMVLT
jgi:hypothetical protein